MDPCTAASVLATVLAVGVRRVLLVRVAAVAFLLWIGLHHHFDRQQAERMLANADAPVGAPPPDPGEVLRVLRRTPAGPVAFVCLGVLALAPVGGASRGAAPPTEARPAPEPGGERA